MLTTKVLTPLTLDEFLMLRSAPHEEPALVRGTREVKIAQSLIERGLLVRDVTARGLLVACTSEGEEVADFLTSNEARSVIAEIQRLRLDAIDFQRASDLEVALLARVAHEMFDFETTAFSKNTARAVLMSIDPARYARTIGVPLRRRHHHDNVR